MVKQFLKGGDAESYEGITIEWIRGLRPVLTIYEDGKKREEVQLADYDNVDALHALMKDKGFHKKAGAAGKTSTTVEVAKQHKAVERIGKTQELGGQLVEEESWTESGPVHGFGLLTGIVTMGGALYYVATNRKKSARSTV